MKTRDTTFPNSVDNEFWEANTPEVDENEENTVFNINNHIYDYEVGNRQETKDASQLPQQANPEKIVTSATADHSEITSPPNIALRSNCTEYDSTEYILCLLLYI